MNPETGGQSASDGVPIPDMTSAQGIELGDRYETVDGKRVEMEPMSFESAGLAAIIVEKMVLFAALRNLGRVYPETKIKLALDVQRNRIPDLIYVPFTKWPKDRPFHREDAWDITPDICIEVVSPTDKYDSVLEHVYEYLMSGVKLVWVVHPRWDRIDVYDGPDRVRVLTRKDTLTGNGVLPGFELPLAELFPAKT